MTQEGYDLVHAVMVKNERKYMVVRVTVSKQV